MNARPQPPDDADDRLDRLADLALGDLDDDGRDRLARLGATDDDALPLRLAAAALARGLVAPEDPMPDSLRARIEAAGVSTTAGRQRPVARRSRALPWAGWLAAASLLGYVAVERRRPAPPAVRPASPAERLAGLVRHAMRATDHPLARGAAGDLVWSGARQEGFLSLRGLAGVEPSKGVYQLWIFDATRDERFPVDGGTFTVRDEAATTLVPFRPTLDVRRPTLFAVTLEPPGGVVVSDRKRILLTASLAP